MPTQGSRPHIRRLSFRVLPLRPDTRILLHRLERRRFRPHHHLPSSTLNLQHRYLCQCTPIIIPFFLKLNARQRSPCEVLMTARCRCRGDAYIHRKQRCGVVRRGIGAKWKHASQGCRDGASLHNVGTTFVNLCVGCRLGVSGGEHLPDGVERLGGRANTWTDATRLWM